MPGPLPPPGAAAALSTTVPGMCRSVTEKMASLVAPAPVVVAPAPAVSGEVERKHEESKAVESEHSEHGVGVSMPAHGAPGMSGRHGTRAVADVGVEHEQRAGRAADRD